MKVLEKEITISKNDLDELNHVNNIVYVNWILEIAKTHWEKLVSTEILTNYHWVLLEHQIKYLHPALLNDKIIIKTYIENSEKIKSSRIVEIYNKDSAILLVNSRTIWCLMNSKSRKPSRITDEIKEAFSK
tara:strand:+ start:336 stop:728 length:393 start_codon:yes stop_codon:yes gene_type:complete